MVGGGLITIAEDLFIYNEAQSVTFNEFLEVNLIQLFSNLFAIATLDNGDFMFDEKSQIIRKVQQYL